MNELDEVLITRLIERIENGNTYILKKIGKTIAQIRNITPTQAYQLQQMVKYGASYKEILYRLSKITEINVNELDEIFNEYAKKDYRFAKKFYDYRGIDYIPFEKFELLKQQTQALSNITKEAYINLSNTSALGFTITDAFGNVRFRTITDAYQYAVDQAILSISQGKDTFDNQMYGILKDIGNGVKILDYESGKTRRLDSALRMNLRGGLRNLHNETQKLLGESFGADGVEISVHENPAPDHADLQGRQFSYEQYQNLQENLPATDYRNITYTHEHRPISEYNCYHTVFSIVLGANKPQYTNEQLEKIKQRNKKGFEFEGKHLTMYEGTQLQRKIETEIRKQKDIQIIGREAQNKALVNDAQYKITQLTNRYHQLSKISGLPTKAKRMRVSNYKRVNVNKL